MKKIIAPLLLSTLACAAQAATITVDDDADDSVPGACTLRDAIASVNDGTNYFGNCAADVTGSLGTDDAIVFDSTLAGATIGVEAPGGGEIVIAKNLVIDASSLSGGITLDANPGGSGPGSNRIFHVTGGDSLKITGVTFRNGNAGSIGDNGGAIFVDNLSTHILTLEQCAFEGNSAYSSGGAVRATYATISNSTFKGNSADYGGAVSAPAATISNSTFEDNEADSDGGAVCASLGIVNISNSTFRKNKATNFRGGAVYAYYPSTISNSTFEGNSADRQGGAVYANSLDARHLTLLNNTVSSGSGQALYALNDSTLHNSIIIGSNGNDQCVVDNSFGATFTGSYNLEGYESSGVWQATTTTCGSSIASPPSIGSALSTIIATTLVDNGGPTKTLKLPTGSPAIGAADPTPYTSGGTSQMLDDQGNWADATLDQRGFARSAIALGRDLGAYEDRRTPPPSASGTPIPALPAPLLVLTGLLTALAGLRLQRKKSGAPQG